MGYRDYYFLKSQISDVIYGRTIGISKSSFGQYEQKWQMKGYTKCGGDICFCFGASERLVKGQGRRYAPNGVQVINPALGKQKTRYKSSILVKYLPMNRDWMDENEATEKNVRFGKQHEIPILFGKQPKFRTTESAWFNIQIILLLCH